MMIECEECKNMKNKYIIQKDIHNKIIIDCNNCIYKEMYNDPIYLKNVELRYIIYPLVNINIQKLINHKNYVYNIYKKHKIIESKILIINNDVNNIFLEDILKVALTNSYGSVEIYLSGILNKEIYITNPNLSSLIITNNLLSLKLNLCNIKLLQIYNYKNDVHGDVYKIFMNYICNFSLNLKKLIIENRLLEIFNKMDFQNKYIKTLKIITKSNKNVFIKDLIELIIKNNNIKNIELNHINENLLYSLNGVPDIYNIIIDKKYENRKYIFKNAFLNDYFIISKKGNVR